MRCWIETIWQRGFLTRERVHGYALVLLAFELTIFALCVAGTHGWIVPLDQPSSSDFVSFYAAGILANHGLPALAYDPAAHYAAEQQATEPGIAYNFYYYPPVFQLLCSLLARLPYLAAFALFQLGTLLPCLFLVRRIAPMAPLGVLLAFPAVLWTVGTGQNAFLTAALLAGAMLALERRPILAGVLMGLLCYKPHFGLLLPVALAAGRNWLAFRAAALTVAVLIAVSGLVFGWSTWSAFLDASARAGEIYGLSDASIDLAGLTSPFGLTLALGGAPALAGALQVIITLATAAIVAWVWRRRVEFAVRAAVLLAAIPVAVPVVMFYDLMLTGLAAAWLVKDGVERGFPPWQRSGLVLLFVAPLLSGNLGYFVQIGIPPTVAALGFGLALRHVAADRGRHVYAPSPVEYRST